MLFILMFVLYAFDLGNLVSIKMKIKTNFLFLYRRFNIHTMPCLFRQGPALHLLIHTSRLLFHPKLASNVYRYLCKNYLIFDHLPWASPSPKLLITFSFLAYASHAMSQHETMLATFFAVITAFLIRYGGWGFDWI